MKKLSKEYMRKLGSKGGKSTAKRGSAYFKKIGKLGAKKRWGVDKSVAIIVSKR